MTDCLLPAQSCASIYKYPVSVYDMIHVCILSEYISVLKYQSVFFLMSQSEVAVFKKESPPPNRLNISQGANTLMSECLSWTSRAFYTFKVIKMYQISQS